MSGVASAPGHDLALWISDLKARKKDQALGELVNAAGAAGIVADAHVLTDLLRLRERLGTSAVGKGVAIPHARSITVLAPRLVIARSPRGIEWGAEDGAVHLVLLVLSPSESSDDTHHAWLARASAMARLQRTRQKLADATSTAEVSAILREALS